MNLKMNTKARDYVLEHKHAVKLSNAFYKIVSNSFNDILGDNLTPNMELMDGMILDVQHNNGIVDRCKIIVKPQARRAGDSDWANRAFINIDHNGTSMDLPLCGLRAKVVMPRMPRWTVYKSVQDLREKFHTYDLSYYRNNVQLGDIRNSDSILAYFRPTAMTRVCPPYIKYNGQLYEAGMIGMAGSDGPTREYDPIDDYPDDLKNPKDYTLEI